jgi:hypothetical protein
VKSAGRYELLEEVGRGAGGVVHRAVDSTLGRTVAVKLLRGGEDPVAVARFDREARAAAALRHPSLVAVLDAGRLADGTPWVAMEWVEGESLRARLKREGRVEAREAARLGAAIARGLAEVHAAGLVHRDVKAENVLLGVDGVPRLSDFGVVGLRDGGGVGGAVARLTRTGELVGTPTAMSPEQANGEASVGAPADVWALGVLLHELLSGGSPFRRESVLATLEAVLTAPLPPLPPEVDRELAQIVLRMLTRDPTRRGTAADHAVALAAFTAGVAERRRDRGRARRRDRRVAAGGAVAAGLLALGAAALLLRRPHGVAPLPAHTEGAPTPTPAPAEVRPRDATPAPAWFLELPQAERPPAVPDGLRFGEKAREYLNEKDGSVMRWVPPGRFVWPDELGGRPVRISRGLFLGRDEVTKAQVTRYWSETSSEPLVGDLEGGGRPLARLPWGTAQRYARWAGGRLPTEAEWLRAACGDDGRRYPWGDEPADLGVDIGKAPAGCAFGLRALGGGVAEWVQDALAPLPPGDGELLDPRSTQAAAPESEPGRVRRVVRGGAAGLDDQYALNAMRRGVALAPATQEEYALFDRAGLRLAIDAGRPPFPQPPVVVRWTVTAWAFPQVPWETTPVPDPPPLDRLVPRDAPQLGPVPRNDLDLPFGNDHGPGTMLGGVHDPSFPTDSFAICATAEPELEPGRYLVHSGSDDGIVVWVDGKRVIDRWTHHATAHDVAAFEVDRRRPVPIRVEYCELFGGGMLLVELLPD